MEYASGNIQGVMVSEIQSETMSKTTLGKAVRAKQQLVRSILGCSRGVCLSRYQVAKSAPSRKVLFEKVMRASRGRIVGTTGAKPACGSSVRISDSSCERASTTDITESDTVGEMPKVSCTQFSQPSLHKQAKYASVRALCDCRSILSAGEEPCQSCSSQSCQLSCPLDCMHGLPHNGGSERHGCGLQVFAYC